MARRRKRLPRQPARSARAAGLRYTTDAKPGIRRIRCGRGFRYLGVNARPVHDLETLRRIRMLAIPPAWTGVWICSRANGHLQATGRDRRGRKQFRYHPSWRRVRDETKYERMIPFGQVLPRIRQRIESDLALRGLPRAKVLATAVRLLETTLIRVGNEEYVRQNGSFGLTTLRDDHVRVAGSTCRFVFRGKSGTKHAVELNDRRLADIVRRCRDLPGAELFQYVGEDNSIHDVTSTDVNEYVREVAGQEFTAKDFRTWAGTVLAACALRECGTFETKAQAKRNLVQAIATVAKRLGNTPAVCRKCYIHPAVLTAYLNGTLLDALPPENGRKPLGARLRLSREEAAVLRFLRRRLARERA